MQPIRTRQTIGELLMTFALDELISHFRTISILVLKHGSSARLVIMANR